MHILTISENILSFVCGFGVLQGVLLAAFIYFHPKSDKSVNIFLALYIICTSAIISLPFIMKLIGWQNTYFVQPIPLLGGPLLYLYLRSFKEPITFRKAAPHFAIAVLYFFLTYWNISRLDKQYPGSENLPAEVLRSPVTIFIQYIKPVQHILYYFLSRKTLLSYQRSIRHLFSETSNIDLQWARFLVNGYLVLVLAFVVIFPLMVSFPQSFNLLLLINMAIATPYIYIATYKGILQHTIWQLKTNIRKEDVQEQIQEVEKNEVAQPAITKAKNEKTLLPGDKIEELIKKIDYLMQKEKIYQETELTLQQLADKLNVPPYQVSVTLNEGMKKSFYDVINGHRVEEAKRLLLDSKSKNYTILSIGFEAGFNSKTTFNTVFKKFTGFTPTEFRDKQTTLAPA